MCIPVTILIKMPLELQVHRLNFELTQALSKKESACSSKDVIDIDSLIAENTYLHDRLQQMEQEKEIAEHSLSKYKVNIISNSFHTIVHPFYFVSRVLSRSQGPKVQLGWAVVGTVD
jgi:hypothetical protein